MEKFREMIPQRLISRFRDLNWPPRSPDFSAPYCSLWCYLKSRVFETRPATLDRHKANIGETIHERVMDDFTKRLQEFITEEEHSTAFCSKKTEQYMYQTQFPRFLLYVNVSVYIICSMKQNLFTN
jgi:hypothetical protein